ncbi:MAG: WecB/TagA/CpsF family glycosyltransferase [Clostridia bacterium]|nr:WecB/TagA/CpsF family glycosyltransferase [Clostridia bacterium]
MDEAVNIIFDFYDEDRLHIVHTTNPEFILKAQKDELYKTILNGADLAVPDGIGTVIASKFGDAKLKERVPGCDLALNLMDKMQGTDYSVYLLGSSQSNLENALKNLQEKYPGLKIAGSHNGYFKDENDEEIIEDINRSGATLLLVGMGGIDKQEKWVWKYKDRIKARVSIGVGGSIDVYGGAVKRAPIFYQKTNLEWLYRTLSEPKKRIPRVYRLPLFVVKAANESLFGPKKPKRK